MAALTALAFVLGAMLARRLAPEPWATGAVLLVALSPPALAYGTAALPELAAGVLLAAACLGALRGRGSPRLRFAYGSALALALLPWLGTRFALPAIPVAVLLVRWTSRRGRRLAALGVAEVMVASAVAFVTANDVLFGGLTPEAAGGTRIAAPFAGGGAEVVWFAPVLALTVLTGRLLARSRRERVAAAFPERLDTEIAAATLIAVCAAQALVAAVLGVVSVVAALPCAAALGAWGLRHAPRAGAALGALTLAASVWLLFGVLPLTR